MPPPAAVGVSLLERDARGEGVAEMAHGERGSVEQDIPWASSAVAWVRGKPVAQTFEGPRRIGVSRKRPRVLEEVRDGTAVG